MPTNLPTLLFVKQADVAMMRGRGIVVIAYCDKIKLYDCKHVLILHENSQGLKLS